MNKQLTVMQRLEVLEGGFNRFDDALETLVKQFKGSVDELSELVISMAKVIGETVPDFDNKVSAMVKERRLAREQAKADQEKKQLEHQIANNKMKSVDLSTPNSLVIGRLFDKEGNVQGVGRLQVSMANLNAALQTALVGKSVGYIHELDGMNKFEFLEIYEPVFEQPSQPEPEQVTATVPQPETTPVVVSV
jgi:hypothetical protein